jgi:ATP-binding cassette subfamily B (MDR/TAP) protein 1
MGDGLVLEQGTHDELLRDENGPYSRLVTAQKLREEREIQLKDSDSITATSVEIEDMEKKARNEIPLGRKNSTTHSLASEIIEQRQKAETGETKSNDHNLLYLFMRMGKINRAEWSSYVLGCIAACRTYLFTWYWCHILIGLGQ